MLRDVGALVLAAGRPQEARDLAAQVRADPDLLDDPSRVHELERSVYGCSVPRASAYLLGLWGFSDRVVHTLAGQPVLPGDAGASDGELAVGFVHQRAVRPEVPVSPAAIGPLTPERAQRWNAACDEILWRTSEDGDA